MYAPTASWLDGSDPSNNFRYRGKNFGKTILTEVSFKESMLQIQK